MCGGLKDGKGDDRAVGCGHMGQGKKTGRDAAGRFARGVSGNPQGRAKGSLNRRTQKLLELLEESGEEIVRGLVKSAKQGKPWAVKLCVDRLLPRAERRVEINLPNVTQAADVADAGAALIEMAAEGEVTIDEARGVVDLIEQQRKAIETTNLEPRLLAVERDRRRELLERKGP